MDKFNKVLLLCKKGRFDIFLSRLLNKFGLRSALFPLFLPYSLMIEPTNCCNLRCPTCVTGSGKMNRQKRFMSFTEFKGIIDQVQNYVVEIFLWHHGEPFLNQELLKMIKYASSKGIYVVVSTNGGFLKSKEFCLEIVKSGLRRLIICLDGLDQETLSKFRGKGADFDTIVNGFKFTNAAKEELRSKLPVVELQFIIMKHNEQQRNELRQFAQELNVDVCREKTVGIPSGDSNFQKLAKELLPNDLTLSRHYVQEDGSFALKGTAPNSCAMVSQTATINSDGTVVPCCYDLYSNYIMGNVFEEDFSMIWNNAKYREFRNQITNDRKSIPICKICPEGRCNI